MSALQELGGEARFKDIYDLVTKKRGGSFAPYLDWMNYKTTMWQRIQQHCEGYKKFTGLVHFENLSGRKHKRNPRFRLVDTRPLEAEAMLPPVPTVEAVDVSEPPRRVLSQIYRVLRDTDLARRIKATHRCKCQVCNGDGLQLTGGRLYAEVHHIQPLGAPHFGPDEPANIICVCPNCHVLLDYGAVKLDVSRLDPCPSHKVAGKYVDYHNEKVFSRVTAPA
jgi:hypothetical protein